MQACRPNTRDPRTAEVRETFQSVDPCLMLEFKLSFDEKDGELGLKLDDLRRTFAPIIFNKPTIAGHFWSSAVSVRL